MNPLAVRETNELDDPNLRKADRKFWVYEEINDPREEIQPDDLLVMRVVVGCFNISPAKAMGREYKSLGASGFGSILRKVKDDLVFETDKPREESKEKFRTQLDVIIDAEFDIDNE